MRWLWSAEAYGVLVALTAAAGSWRTGWTVRVAAWALFASWAVSRLVAGRLDLAAVAVVHVFIHIALLLVLVVALVQRQALWLALAVALAAGQAVGNVAVVVLADPLAAGPRPVYDRSVAVLFALMLACVWLALTPLGRWWPRTRRAR